MRSTTVSQFNGIVEVGADAALGCDRRPCSSLAGDTDSGALDCPFVFMDFGGTDLVVPAGGVPGTDGGGGEDAIAGTDSAPVLFIG